MMTNIQNIEDKATLRVLDFTRYMPGPIASRVLTDIGAHVIKIENPKTGDANRGFAPFIHGQGLFHVALNAGTRSVAIDRRSPDWPQLIEAGVRWADAVLVGGLPEGLSRLGIDFDSLVKINPRIVHCNVTGYGETGPWRTLPAHGLNPDAFAGIVPVEWRDGLPFPHASYQSAGAPLSGLFAALGILAALRRRDATGEPQRLHVSLLGAAIWWNWRHVTAFANLGEEWWSYANFGGRYATYPASDQKIILVCPIEKNFWQSFCDVLGLPEDWKTRGTWGKSEMDHGTGYPWERAEIARKIAEKPRDYWVEEFTKVRIPFAPLLSLEEMLAAPHIEAIGAMRDVDVDGHSARIPSFPVQFSGDTPHAMRPPGLGEHNSEVFDELGIRQSSPVPAK